jgi:hypothetical protein
MRTAVKLGGAVLGLGTAFGVAYGAGHVLTDRRGGTSRAAGHAPVPRQPALVPWPVGLTVSRSGYTLRPQGTRLHDHGNPVFTFTITGPDGAVVRRFTPVAGTGMDLVVVGRDLSGYRHVQPDQQPDGTWSVPLRLPAPGTYRVFAVFEPAGTNKVLTLGTDVVAGGFFQPKSPPPPSRTVQTAGLEVGVAGWLRARQVSRLVFSLADGGVPVRDLQPYLGAHAHLVAVRGGDLADLPVWARSDGAGPDLVFDVAVPGPGTYRLFLDFMHGGGMRTAAFTMIATGGSG